MEFQYSASTNFIQLTYILQGYSESLIRCKDQFSVDRTITLTEELITVTREHLAEMEMFCNIKDLKTIKRQLEFRRKLEKQHECLCRLQNGGNIRGVQIHYIAQKVIKSLKKFCKKCFKE